MQGRKEYSREADAPLADGGDDVVLVTRQHPVRFPAGGLGADGAGQQPPAEGRPRDGAHPKEL